MSMSWSSYSQEPGTLFIKFSFNDNTYGNQQKRQEISRIFKCKSKLEVPRQLECDASVAINQQTVSDFRKTNAYF